MGWNKYASNPILNLGTSGAWDDAHVLACSVIKDGDTYKMWYTGGDGTTYRIGYATSPDGIVWTKYGSNPILDLGAGWDGSGVGQPSVIKDGTVYKMWYTGTDGTTYRIGYATSPDGIVWTREGSNPVLNIGASGAWDDAQVYARTVIKDGTTYKMWYAGNDGTTYRGGYATSPDGVVWTKHGSNPILNVGTGWESVGVYPRCVLKEDTIYKMWYGGKDATIEKIGYATSPDGVVWTKDSSNPVLDIGASGAWDDAQVLAPNIMLENGVYKMWYSGGDGANNRIGYAILGHSLDTYQQNSSLTANPATFTKTCGTGSTGLILHLVIVGATARTGGAPTYNGVVLEQIDTVRIATETNVEMWFLQNPPTGSAYTISIPNTNTRTIHAFTTSIIAPAGHTSIPDVAVGGTGTAANPSLPLTSNRDGCFVTAICGHGVASLTGVSGNKTRYGGSVWGIDHGAYCSLRMYELQTVAALSTFTFTVGADDWAAITAAFKQVKQVTLLTKQTISTETPSGSLLVPAGAVGMVEDLQCACKLSKTDLQNPAKSMQIIVEVFNGVSWDVYGSTTYTGYINSTPRPNKAQGQPSLYLKRSELLGKIVRARIIPNTSLECEVGLLE